MISECKSAIIIHKFLRNSPTVRSYAKLARSEIQIILLINREEKGRRMPHEFRSRFHFPEWLSYLAVLLRY